jgi:hypothetical protein
MPKYRTRFSCLYFHILRSFYSTRIPYLHSQGNWARSLLLLTLLSFLRSYIFYKALWTTSRYQRPSRSFYALGKFRLALLTDRTVSTAKPKIEWGFMNALWVKATRPRNDYLLFQNCGFLHSRFASMVASIVWESSLKLAAGALESRDTS